MTFQRNMLLAIGQVKVGSTVHKPQLDHFFQRNIKQLGIFIPTPGWDASPSYRALTPPFSIMLPVLICT